MTVKAPRPTEAQFMHSVTDYAMRRGWVWAHLATAMYKDTWRTPFSGPLGKGFSDLLLFHPARCRTLFAELKRGPAEKRATPKVQLDFLEAAAAAGNETALWEPGDWSEIEKVLR
jgi:hypothetical protein